MTGAGSEHEPPEALPVEPVDPGGDGAANDGPGAEPPAPQLPPQIDVRFSFANERTFLAWNRTALALVTAGLAITQQLPPFDVPGGRKMIGMPLIILGIVLAIASLRQWRKNEEAMHKREPLPASPLPVIVAVVIGVSAVIAGVLAAFGGAP